MNSPAIQELDSQYFTVGLAGNAGQFSLRDEWSINTIGQLEAQLDVLALHSGRIQSMEFQCGGLTHLDLSGAWLLYRTAKKLRDLGIETQFSGFRAEHLQFIEDVLDIEKIPPSSRPIRSTPKAVWDFFAGAIVRISTETTNRGRWFSAIAVGLASVILHPKRFRVTATARHIHDAGISAIGIVVLMAFLVAMVLGFQAKSQLAQLGAQIYTIDLVSISVLREMGGLLTAILVAGRSGSAFAAEIGVMQLNEELSAMETMGIDPYETLIIPRMAALLICLPLLTFVADIAGLLGTLLMAPTMLDIPASLAIERFLALDPVNHFRAGMIKAPFFALVIGMIGTYRGYYVQRSADAVGRNTTAAVVESIFMVIAVDALFSLIFTEIGW
ncbi:MAG: phospholipid/cholesterol/gamma-HCH transport system permease protein [Halieaceae bacterium]|jgi:phospholipid/cholesterol/gamma-HCH transport system permease protein